eukprot:CAMPEP_0195580994 /NCGR_PEP_ID=MMETSP0814-20130614/19319_1 /TAXON_ID=97485 /ORGANISM="Prymnesium parvum, Strain Texoma1" /LENGTH=78 /DNA_ID=CAMNT_0040718267 /DNA_START=44 /DNA_END=280 /DNA_ORIENTATION=+
MSYLSTEDNAADVTQTCPKMSLRLSHQHDHQLSCAHVDVHAAACSYRKERASMIEAAKAYKTSISCRAPEMMLDIGER